MKSFLIGTKGIFSIDTCLGSKIQTLSFISEILGIYTKQSQIIIMFINSAIKLYQINKVVLNVELIKCRLC